MTEKEAQKKIAACKKLQGMTVGDIIKSQRFTDNLAAYISAQREDRKAIQKSYAAMRKLGSTRGLKLPAHVIDRLMDLSVTDFAAEYGRIIDHRSERPAAERKYIQQLGGQAYNLTIAQYVIEEFPETKNYFFPKHETN